MNQLKITRTAFNEMNLLCGDSKLSIEQLSQSDMFFPILLLLAERHLADKTLFDKVVSYQLIFNRDSFLYVEAQHIDIKNEAAFIDIIDEIDGVKQLITFFDLKEDADTEYYDLMRLCKYIRSKLTDSTIGMTFDNNSFDFLFDHISLEPLPVTFVNDLKIKLDNAISIQDFDFERDVLNATKISQFDLTQIYPNLNSDDKKIFDELAVLACSNYLSESSSVQGVAQIDNDIALPVDEQLMLGAIINHKSLLDCIAKRLNCQSYQVVFDEDVYALREKLQLTATTRSFEFESGTTTWHKCAKRLAAKLKLSDSLTKCFAESIQKNKFDTARFVEVFLQQNVQSINSFLFNNQFVNNTVKAAMTSQKIKHRLNRNIIGQDAAVRDLCQGYLTSCVERSNGPRIIYTFAGPSGVGKTFLASQLQSQLNEFEKTGYGFNIFNMEQYSDKRDTSKLFGSGIQYTDASLGMLTSEVRAQPRQILLFDEIEKANNNVIQSLLSILDTGIIKDQTSQEEIDFSQCIIIFTTNLGQETIKKNTQNIALSIFDLLQQSENPSDKTALSPEFINRLAKGFPILFSDLKVNHLIRLAEMQINGHDPLSSTISYDWPDNFASLMLQSMSPDISVRALKSNLSKHKSMLLNHATRYFSENTKDVCFEISIEQPEKNIDVQKSQLLLLDDDARVFDQLQSFGTKYKASLCSEIENLSHAIETFHPDALLIDIETLNNNNVRLSDLISNLIMRNHKTPIFTYCLNGSGGVESKVLAHEIREHFVLNLCDLSTSFSEMLTRVSYYLVTERSLSNMKRRNEQLQYQCEITFEDNVFQAKYKNLAVTQLIDSADLKEGDLFKHSLPTLKLDDVIGLERAKKRLAEVVNWLKSPEKLANFDVKVPSGFLFAGPPGTGKTFLAKALAGESGLPFFSVSSSELSESHAGGTTKNIKKLFATARRYAPAIIFIDEIDAIAGKRSASTQASNRDNNLTVNALLTEMDGFTSQSEPIFILAATNHPQLLDSAIVRPGRFDETIYCDLPNVEARKHFFSRFSQKHKITFSEEEIKQLVSSSQGMSSAEIEQVFREAIYQAVGDNKALTSENIKQTMIRVSYGLPSAHIVLSTQEKLRTAYHEAGHLLLSKLLFPKQPIDFVTIEPRNNSLGFVATRAAEEYESLSSTIVKHRLEMLLAGRVAEKIITGSFDEVSSGASGDIEKATRLAMHVIYEGGLDASVGPINVGLLTKFEESELLLEAQAAVKHWLLEAEASVEARLIAHREQLDLIANALIEKESLIGEEIEALFL